MTTTAPTTTERDLLAAAAETGDSTPLLLYADAYEERTGDARRALLVRIGAEPHNLAWYRGLAGALRESPGCEACGGSGVTGRPTSRDITCYPCHGTGGADRAWAEWITLECDKADGIGPLDAWQLRDRITNLSRTLTPILRRGEKCGECKGTGKQAVPFDSRRDPSEPAWDCLFCRGVRWLGALGETEGLNEIRYEMSHPEWLIRADFTHGVPTGITLDCATFTRKGWAAKVWQEWPSIGSVVLGDKEPEEHIPKSGVPNYSWYNAGFNDDPATIPDPLFSLMKYEMTAISATIRKAYSTPDLARAALSQACVAWMRGAKGVKDE